MNIHDLRAFLTVAKLENVSKAAELLHMSQSSLSKTIAALEKELGTKLFDRNGKRLTLNSIGQRFLESSQVIISEADEAVKDIQLMKTGYTSVIRLSAAGINASLFECMASFKKLHPETIYEIDCMIDNDELPDINAYDMIIYPDELKYQKFRGYDFYEEKYYLAVNADSDLGSRISASQKMLEGQNYVFLRYENNRIEYPYRVCTALAVDVSDSSFVDSRELHRQMIAAGIGIGFVPAGSAEMYRHNGQIRLIPLVDGRFMRPMKVCFKREKHLSELAAAFKKHVMTAFEIGSESSS